MATTLDAARVAVSTPPFIRSSPSPKPNPVRVRMSVVVPTRNEAGNVDALERKLDSALAGVDYEVVVVDDSTDVLTRPALRAAAIRVFPQTRLSWLRARRPRAASAAAALRRSRSSGPLQRLRAADRFA